MVRPAPVTRPVPDVAAPIDEAQLELRFLRPDEAGALTEAIERSYGDTYDCRWVYDADEVERRLRDGTLRSLVATLDGRVVGHVGLGRRGPDDLVGEAGQAVVDPALRGRHLFERLKRRLRDDCRDRGLLGIFSEATAAHPYSQKANLALGASETGFLLGYIPASVEYRDIDAHRARRQSAALFYLETNPSPRQTIHPPPWHRRIIERIATHVGVPRHVEESDGTRAEGSSRLRVEAHEDHREAFVTVEHLGADARSAVAETTHGLAERCDCVYLDLRLTDPSTATLPPAVHTEVGYFFGGIIPHLDHGDVLRLQYLHDVRADPSDVAVASDFGAELLDYVFAREAEIA